MFISNKLNEAKKTFDNYTASRPLARAAIGAVLGLGLSSLCQRITPQALNKLVGEARAIELLKNNPFSEMPFIKKILLIPVVCIARPVAEEIIFRGAIMHFTEKSADDYLKNYFSESTAKKLAVVASILFSSVLFGLVHFGNALFFNCHPIKFLPQVVSGIFAGIGLGIAQKCMPKSWDSPTRFDRVQLPIFMHIANNCRAYLHILKK